MPTHLRLTTSLLVDLVLPLALCCGLCAIDVDEWLALGLGEALPLARLGHALIGRGRPDVFAICAIAVVVGARITCTVFVQAQLS
ncbi:MAG TPA: hypothetical protein VGN81_32365 [Pseudonocardiaceae bacterium]|jgi:hypothetical protein